jgi:hypothetical protein
MKIRALLIVVALVALGGCAHNAANEHKYAGSPGSAYDAALNPPQAHGAVTYDAASPIVPHDYGNGGAGTATR